MPACIYVQIIISCTDVVPSKTCTRRLSMTLSSKLTHAWTWNTWNTYFWYCPEHCVFWIWHSSMKYASFPSSFLSIAQKHNLSLHNYAFYTTYLCVCVCDVYALCVWCRDVHCICYHSYHPCLIKHCWPELAYFLFSSQFYVIVSYLIFKSWVTSYHDYRHTLTSVTTYNISCSRNLSNGGERWEIFADQSKAIHIKMFLYLTGAASVNSSVATLK